MNTTSRTAGIALLVYVIGTTVCFGSSMGPGGNYHDSDVIGFITDPDRWLHFTLYYVGALASLGLLVFGLALRRSTGPLGPLVVQLATVGTALSVAGAFVVGGFEVAMVEGGAAVRDPMPHAVAYTFGEFGNLLMLCGPSMFVGIIAIVLAVRTPMPGWLRGYSVIAGVCGILGPLYFTLGFFLIWALVFGVWMLIRRVPAATADPDPQQLVRTRSEAV